MSDLPDTNGEAAREWLTRSRLIYSRAPGAMEAGDSKLAVRDLASAAELALKAVYIKDGRHYLRTQDIGDLVRECPDRTVEEVLEGYSDRFVRMFSQNYLAPYVRAHPVSREEVEECRQFCLRIVDWATGVIDP